MLYYLPAIISGLLLVLFMQVMLLNKTIESRNEQFTLRAEQALKELQHRATNSYHCFLLNANTTIASQDRLVITTGSEQLDTIQEFFIADPKNPSKRFPYFNPQLTYDIPVEARIAIQFSFLGTEDGAPKGAAAADLRTLAWVDSSYSNTLRDAVNKARIVDTFRLVEQANETFASLAAPEQLGLRVRHAETDEVLFEHNRAALDEAVAEEVFQTELHEDAGTERPYLLEVGVAGGLDQSLASIFYLAIGLIAVSLFTGVLLVLSIKMIWNQKRLAERKNDFVNNMTHEFKTPITNIRLAVDTLKMRMDDYSDHNDLFEAIIQENDRIDQSLNRILNVARLEDQLELHRQPTDAMELIDSVLDHMQLRLQDRVDIDVQHENEDARLSIDRVLMQGVLQTIIDNSIKYSVEKPRIEIKTRQHKNTCSIVIRDYGLGMTEDELARSFDKFYRAANHKQHDVKGFGLGLYYAKTIIHKHGGQISATSKKNYGSTFTIELPVLSTEAKAYSDR